MGIHALVVLLLAVVIVGFVMWCVEVKLLRHWELVEESDILPDLKDGASVYTQYFNCWAGL